MTKPGSHKIYLANRKGFVKLALQYGCDLVPMVWLTGFAANGLMFT